MSKPLLIVLDDEQDMAEFVAEVADGLGFETRIAGSVQKFQNIWTEGMSATIVMDLVMPDKDGIELLRWLSEKRCSNPIIVMSGFNGRYVDAACKLGKDRGLSILGVLSKPVSLNDIETLLKQALLEDLTEAGTVHGK